MWCFTKQQLKLHPVCYDWDASYQEVKGHVEGCYLTVLREDIRDYLFQPTGFESTNNIGEQEELITGKTSLRDQRPETTPTGNKHGH